jgi:hypothetical protein
MKSSLIFFMLLCLSFLGCGQEDRNVIFFKGTEAYELAQAVAIEDLQKIERLVRETPALLNITNKTSGSNVLDLSLTIENYQAFNILLELGATPNFINPYSKRSILIEACKFYQKPKPYTIDLRYIELLLKYGANPNYVVEEDFTDEKGHYQKATSPLMEASKLDLGMVKLLIKAGANPYKKLKQSQQTPFYAALTGFKNKVEISNFYIDSLKVNLSEPVAIFEDEETSMQNIIYIQDVAVNKFLKAKLANDTIEMNHLKRDNPKIEEANLDGWEFILKLESMGVDFKNYKYK